MRLEQNEECIILTADRNVANMEKTVLDTLKGCGAEFRVNVMSFTRFCVKNMGERVKRCLTPEGSVMLLADVIEKCNDKFVYYRRVRPDSLANEVYAALTALRNSGVSTDNLREKAEKLPIALRNKSLDLSLIYEGYLEALSEKREDSTTRLAAFADMLNENPGKNASINFFVVGMDDFNKPQIDVLRALDNGVKSLTVGFVVGYSNRNERIYPTKIYTKIKGKQEDKIPENFCPETMSPIRLSILKNLFSYVKLPKNEILEVKDEISIKKALTRQDEVLFVALDIVKKIRNGARYKDFEILIGSEDYIPIIRNIFDRYGIVHFIDQKELLVRQAKAKYLLSALQVVIRNYRNEEVLDFVKNSLFELSLDGEAVCRQDKIFKFENYVLKYNINYNKFTQPFDCGKEEEIHEAEEVRKALVERVGVLGGNGVRSMADIVAGVRTLLDNVAIPWGKHVEMLVKESKHFKKCAEQVDNKIKGILDEIEGVLTGESTVEKFDTILRSMLKTLKIALVPTFLDSVFVGDMSSKFTGNGDLYVLGANSGQLPAESAGGTIITAKDEKLFEEAEIELYPTQADRLKKGLFKLVEILAGCKGKLTISFSASSAGGALNPSTIILQFAEMFKTKRKKVNGEGYEMTPLKEELITFDKLSWTMATDEDLSVMFAGKDKGMHSILTYAESGRAGESDVAIYRSAFNSLDDENKALLGKIRKDPDNLENAKKITKTSLSRLEQYFKCPYAYFLNYTLGLQKREEGDVEGFDSGIILHAVFEGFFMALRDGITKNGKKKDLERDDVEHVALTAFDNLIKGDERLARLYEKADTKRLFNRLKFEGVRTCKDLFEISLRSEFKPKYLEAEFIGEKEAKAKYGDSVKDRVLFDPIVLDIDGRQVEIRGKIDRVDVCVDESEDHPCDHFLIFDYKTFKSADIGDKDIYHGEKLQLYIYAKAMKDNIDKNVAGVFYVPIYAGFNKNGEKRYSYEGQVTDNEGIRNRIFKEFAEGEELTSARNPLPKPQRKDTIASTYLSEEGFKSRSDYAIDIAKEGVKEIESGYIKPVPIKSGQISCAFCNFKKVCAYRELNARERYDVDGSIFTEYNNPKTDETIENNEVENNEGGNE